MKHIIVAPDSFKGTISSSEACKIIKKAFAKVFKNPIITLPIADGGEGSIDAFLHAKKGEKIYLQSTNPNFKTCKSFYALLDDKTAIIETATTAGLTLAKNKNPSLTTTFGVGEQIKHAIKNGSKHIIICLGGSATNDAGCGLACALGAKFFDKNKQEFIPVGATLNNIENIDLKNLRKNIKGVKFTTMCDINNPLYGKKGAAYVFAPQKGADEKMVKYLDKNLKYFARKIKNLFGVDLQKIKGSGAAGGMGGGLFVFLNSPLKMGIEVILKNISFEKLLKNALFVISGEGKIDSQSIDGKAICGIASKCKNNVPLICIVGGFEGDLKKFYKLGISSIFSTNKMPQSLDKIKSHKQNLFESALNVAKSINLLL